MAQARPRLPPRLCSRSPPAFSGSPPPSRAPTPPSASKRSASPSPKKTAPLPPRPAHTPSPGPPASPSIPPAQALKNSPTAPSRISASSCRRAWSAPPACCLIAATPISSPRPARPPAKSAASGSAPASAETEGEEFPLYNLSPLPGNAAELAFVAVQRAGDRRAADRHRAAIQPDRLDHQRLPGRCLLRLDPDDPRRSRRSALPHPPAQLRARLRPCSKLIPGDRPGAWVSATAPEPLTPTGCGKLGFAPTSQRPADHRRRQRPQRPQPQPRPRQRRPLLADRHRQRRHSPRPSRPTAGNDDQPGARRRPRRL